MQNLVLSFLFLVGSIKGLTQVPAYKVSALDSSLSTGYYFLSQGAYMMILDHFGELVYYRKDSSGGYFFSLGDDGRMIYSSNHKFYISDSTFNRIDSVECKGLIDTDPREMQVLPNGHFLVLGSEAVKMDLSRYFLKGRRCSDTAMVTSAVIQEQDANQNVVFEWHAKDHFSFDDLDTTYSNSGTYLDLAHANCLEQDSDGNLLMSCRNFNEITKISRIDGSLIWRLGGKRNQFKFVNSANRFLGQHDVRRLSNGNVTLYDGGANISKELTSSNATLNYARALEFQLDEEKRVAREVWSYIFDSTMYSASGGNVQRLGNSNTLINFGNTPSRKAGFVVVKPSGTIIFRVDSMTSYRVFNYPSLPWKLHRPEISCIDSSGGTYLDAGANYKSYQWSSGEATRIIKVEKPGSYSVFVPYGDFGFICSERFLVKEINQPCSIESTRKAKNKF